MGYQIYKVGPRWGGYGVPAICEYPTCHEEIDRGISYACGGEPFSELGCDRYFCSKHLDYIYYSYNSEGDYLNKCKHKEDCDCEIVRLCKRCSKGKKAFPYKPEHQDWIKHLLKDESWAEWRENNPEEVKIMKQKYANTKTT